MVGPIERSERRVSTIVLGVGFTLLIGVSAGAMALQSRASLGEIAIVLTAGMVVGGVLTWYLHRIVKLGSSKKRVR